jgi:hypothetical protein
MYDVSPTTDIDAETNLPKVRNWETHLELDNPPGVVDITDHDISPEVNAEKLFRYYQSIGNPSGSSSGSSSSGAFYPDPD